MRTFRMMRSRTIFALFFQVPPPIRLTGFNGGTAAKLNARHVVAALTWAQRSIAAIILPSGSPAHPGLPFPQKTAR
jgi:G:T/U-mismatch repair DNA glycosylase